MPVEGKSADSVKKNVCEALIRGWPGLHYLKADWAGKNLLLRLTARIACAELDWKAERI